MDTLTVRGRPCPGLERLPPAPLPQIYHQQPRRRKRQRGADTHTDAHGASRQYATRRVALF